MSMEKAPFRSRSPILKPENLLLRGFRARQDAANAAVMHDREQLRRNHNNGQAAFRQVDHQAMDLRFRTDIHALRRLVQDENFGSDGKPAREGDLLLIAARELSGRGKHPRAS